MRLFHIHFHFLFSVRIEFQIRLHLQPENRGVARQAGNAGRRVLVRDERVGDGGGEEEEGARGDRGAPAEHVEEHAAEPVWELVSVNFVLNCVALPSLFYSFFEFEFSLNLTHPLSYL